MTLQNQVTKRLIVLTGGTLDPRQTSEFVQLFDADGNAINAITFDETPGGADVTLTGYTVAGAAADLTDTDTANVAFGKVEKRIQLLEAHDTSSEMVITGYTVAVANAALANTDTLNVALGKIQKQLNDLDGRVDALEA